MSLMLTGAITNYIDVAQVTLYIFFIFFALLVLYLQKESRREGFPLQNDGSDTPRSVLTSWMPTAKTFKLASGGVVSAPNGLRESQDIKARRMGPWHGSAYIPTGDPMVDAVGPASYAQRADVPDRIQSGAPRIVPLRADGGYHIGDAGGDANPIGMTVVGADGVVAGTVCDVWVDRAEAMMRYLEAQVGERRVLIPINFVNRMDGQRGVVSVDAILGGQFAGVPGTKNPDTVTLLEEDKIAGYFGGGTLYATAQRAEPLL